MLVRNFRYIVTGILVLPILATLFMLMFWYGSDGRDAWWPFLWAMGVPVGGYFVACMRLEKSRKTLDKAQAWLFFAIAGVFCVGVIIAEGYFLHSATHEAKITLPGHDTSVVTVRYTPSEATGLVCDYLGPVLTLLLFAEIAAAPLKGE